MRVIAGAYRNRRVYAPPGTQVRPTPERVREALFSILGPDLAGIVFMDLYAGAGTVGIEALSRGAERAVFVEKDSRALHTLHSNLKTLGCFEKSKVIAAPVENLWPRHFADVDVVFMDPPYGSVPFLPYLRDYLESTERHPVLVYQHPHREPGLTWLPETVRCVKERRYSRTALSVYQIPFPEEEENKE